MNNCSSSIPDHRNAGPNHALRLNCCSCHCPQPLASCGAGSGGCDAETLCRRTRCRVHPIDTTMSSRRKPTLPHARMYRDVGGATSNIGMSFQPLIVAVSTLNHHRPRCHKPLLVPRPNWCPIRGDGGSQQSHRRPWTRRGPLPLSLAVVRVKKRLPFLMSRFPYAYELQIQQWVDGCAMGTIPSLLTTGMFESVH